MDQLYFVVHTHWDREWYQPFEQMRARLVAMTDRMLALAESGAIPYFHFDGQTIVLDDYLAVRPENERRLRALIRAGRIQIGPWYVLADSFLVSGESLIRNLELGAAGARRFGEPLRIGYLPDQFGHAAQIPQILSGFGFRTAVTWRGVARDVTSNRFIWQALDGTEVVTVYLPFGYSNGANLPLDSLDQFAARVREIASRERPFAAGDPVLVMNGTDHADPDPRLASAVAALDQNDGLSLEIGTLERYMKRLAEAPTDGLARHRGELRSPARAHLLPGVTSARTWIKQRDFQNCYLLERLADPLAGLAGAQGDREGGGANDLCAFLDLAWRYEIQNHPHDSICGCSIDQVHEDMRYRFDQAAIVAEQVVRSASRALIGAQPVGAAIAVFNPTFARQALVSADAELEDPTAHFAVLDATGRKLQPAIDVIRAERVFQTEIGAADFKPIVAALSRPAFMERTVTRYELRGAPRDRCELDLWISRAAASDVDLRAFQRDVAAIPDGASIRIRATSAARARINFAAEGLTQAGFTFYRLVREDGGGTHPAAGVGGKPCIENEFYRIRPAPRGFEISDLATGATMELHLEDDGDRGDEYNFDPVAGASAIDAPETSDACVIEAGPARKRLKTSLGYRLPQKLHPDRSARAAEMVDVPATLTATLYAGLARIDFDAEVDNRASDHRLRAILRTPIIANESVSDTAFGVVRRALKPAEAAGTEDIYPTAPHRTWTAVESTEFSAAIVSRGLYETEVRPEPAGSAILLTLLRCVGWLSRSDLATRRAGAGPELETPGAQDIGKHRFEFCVTTWRGAYHETDFVQRAEAYAFPPRAFAGDAAAGRSIALLSCDNPHIAFSTARPRRSRGLYIVRVWNTSSREEQARFGFAADVRVRAVDLRGERAAIGRLRRDRDNAIAVKLRPFQIVTFEVRAAGGKNFHASGGKD